MSISPATVAGNRGVNRDLFGHPRGLTYLFATEMWERFSYYGMRALLVLYMVKYLLDPARAGNVVGLGPFRSALEFVFCPLALQPLASQIYGFYTGLVYLTPIFGGLLADRVLGQRRTVILGAALMAVGHFMMAFEHLFLLALIVLILGNGAFKPNISTQVGALYAPGDRRRDRAFSIFYVGINLGAAGLRHARRGTWLALWLRCRRRWHDHWPRDLSARRPDLAARRIQRSRNVRSCAPPRAMAGDRCDLGADAAGEFVLGHLRAAGQHDRALGRPAYRPPLRFLAVRRRDSGHLVPGVQSVHDLRLHAARGCAVAPAGPSRAVDGRQDGDRLFPQCRGLSGHGRRRRAGRSRTDELAVAVRLFRRHHRRRTLFVADRAFAGDEGRSVTLAVDDDGRVVIDQLHRRISRRLPGHLLVEHGEDRFFPDAGDHLSHGRCRDRVAEPPAALNTA